MVTTADKANVCVYFLRDPRDLQPRYVGISSKPSIRFTQHWSERRTDYSYCCEKREWLKELDSLGLRPIMDVLLSDLTRQQAKRVEHHIASGLLRNRPGQLLQSPTGLFDPVDSIRELWEKSHIKQRQAIRRFIDSQLPAS